MVFDYYVSLQNETKTFMKTENVPLILLSRVDLPEEGRRRVRWRFGLNLDISTPRAYVSDIFSLLHHLRYQDPECHYIYYAQIVLQTSSP